jgi:uncharacterized protein YoxC
MAILSQYFLFFVRNFIFNLKLLLLVIYLIIKLMKLKKGLKNMT